MDLLLRLAEFLISQEQGRKQQQGQGTNSQEQLVAPSLTSTPTGGGSGAVGASSVSPSVVTSPSVAEYLRSMPKKSPVKSPLVKYRRMKQLRQQSPLRAAEKQQRNKVVTRLNFEPSQCSNMTAPAAQVEISSPPSLPLTHQSPNQPQLLAPSSSPGLISGSPSKASHNRAKASSIVSSAFANILPRPITAPRPSPSTFSAPKINTEKEKRKDKLPQKVHLVTVSKKSLKSSGSFSRLDLSNLFTAVNQNLKDVQTDGTEKLGDKEKESDIQQQQQELSQSPSLPFANTSAPSIPATLGSSTGPVSTSRQSSASEEHPTLSDPPSPLVPVTTISAASPSQSLAAIAGGGDPPQPSPLEQLASQVASHPLPQLPLPPPSVISSTAASQMYNAMMILYIIVCITWRVFLQDLILHVGCFACISETINFTDVFSWWVEQFSGWPVCYTTVELFMSSIL